MNSQNKQLCSGFGYMCDADVVFAVLVQWEVLCESALFAHPLGSRDNPSPLASNTTVLKSASDMG